MPILWPIGDGGVSALQMFADVGSGWPHGALRCH